MTPFGPRITTHAPIIDWRAIWLAQHARPGDDVIIGIPSIDPYYRANFFFLQSDDDRYDDYACREGTVERWTNLPFCTGAMHWPRGLRREGVSFW